MTLSPSLCEHSLPVEDVCCKETIHPQPKDTQQTTLMSNCHQPIAIITTVGAICMVIIVSLFIGTFMQEPGLEPSNDCDVSITMETLTTIVTFFAGWIFCLVARQRHNLVRTIVCSTDHFLASISSSASTMAATVSLRSRSTGGWLASQVPSTQNIAAMAMVCTMCSCIIGLFVSAFTAVPDEELSDNDFDSESSPSMKAFTLGWMIMLSFKIRHELAGVVGLSCFLQPW